MEMARRCFARLDERVDALDAQSRTSESKGSLGGHNKSKREKKPLHLCRMETSEASNAVLLKHIYATSYREPPREPPREPRSLEVRARAKRSQLSCVG